MTVIADASMQEAKCKFVCLYVGEGAMFSVCVAVLRSAGGVSHPRTRGVRKMS